MIKIQLILWSLLFIACARFQSDGPQTLQSRIPAQNILVDSSSGIPSLSKANLDLISYVPVKTNKLKKARVVWLNFDLLREKGIEIPKEGLTPEFERSILDQFGFMVKSERDSQDAFLPEEKILYADRYGGVGIGVNWGSGRAASTGDYQIKGSGQTPLIGDGQVFDHAHGGASFNEAIQEAVWGEVNQQELPFGSNRVLTIIDSGTDTTWTDGTKEARALIVREDPLRPAHYLETLDYGGEKNIWKNTDEERVHKNFSNFLHSLPLPANVDRAKLSEKEILNQGMEEFTDRLTQQFAAANARKILHGGISPSNIDLSGKFLDFGTETTLSDFGKAIAHPGGLAFHEEVTGHLNRTIFPMIDMIHKELKDDADGLFTHEQLSLILEEKFKKYQKIEFLNLLGIPDHLNRKFIENSYANDLAETMLKIAFWSDSTYDVDKKMPAIMSPYPTIKIFKMLGATQNTDPLKLEDEIGNDLPYSVKKALAKNYSNYIKYILEEAENEGVSTTAFYQYQHHQSLIKNKAISELYRSNLRDDNVKLIDQFKVDGDRNKVWKAIDNKITSSRMTYKDLSPYQVVLDSRYNRKSGEAQYLIFDAKKNQQFLKIISPINQKRFAFYDNQITLNSSRDIPIIRYTENNWNAQREIKGIVVNENIEFDLPISDDSNRLEFIMRSEDSSIWWKNAGSNGVFNIEGHDNTHHSINSCDSILKSFI